MWEVGLDPDGGVDGPLMYRAKPAEPSDAEPLALIAGELRLDDGCLTIGGHLVLWPYGMHWQPDPPRVVYPSGFVQLVGTTVEEAGAYRSGPMADLTSVPAVIELGERCLRLGDGEIALPNPSVVIANG